MGRRGSERRSKSGASVCGTESPETLPVGRGRALVVPFGYSDALTNTAAILRSWAPPHYGAVGISVPPLSAHLPQVQRLRHSFLPEE